MKLLHVFPSFSAGGQQMRLAAAANALGDEFEHVVFSLDGRLSAASAFKSRIHSAHLTSSKTSGSVVANIHRLRRELSNAGADALCTYNFGSIEAAIANRLGPKLPHLHHEDGFGAEESAERQKQRRVLLRRLALRKSLVVVPSRALERAAAAVWRLPPENIRRISNGVDAMRFAPAARAARSGVVVGSVGALRPEKDYMRLVEAFRAAGRGDAQLVLFGDGPERDKIARVAHGAPNVELAGETTTPEKAYAGFDIFALASRTEQAPLSVLEAMASGLPVIATDVGEIREMVSEDNRPFIVARGDRDVYVKALSRLIGDGELRARIGAANRQRAVTEYPLDRMVARHRALWLEAAGAPA